MDSPELAALMASRKSCSTLRSEACCVRIDNERVELYADLFCEIGWILDEWTNGMKGTISSACVHVSFKNEHRYPEVQPQNIERERLRLAKSIHATNVRTLDSTLKFWRKLCIA